MSRSRLLPPLLTRANSLQLLGGQRRVSLDLGLTTVMVDVVGSMFVFPGGVSVSRDDVEEIADRDNAVFFASPEGVFQVALSDSHYYKLVPTGGAPTLEIDGIRMHRTKGTSPEVDAGVKLRVLDVRGGLVLDTCSGLGYTAAEAVRRGAEAVVSVERSHQVARIAVMNPWSRSLFSCDRVHYVLGDSFDLTGALPGGVFDYVVHDPPRLSLAGELYGSEFYGMLFRVLKPGGGLYHYTGEPGGRYRGRDLPRGVAGRLRAAGFSGLRYIPEALGVVAVKGDG